MAVISNELGMTSQENEKHLESSHEHNLYVDRQLQNKLLQVDEDSDIEAYENKLSKNGSIEKMCSKSKHPVLKVDDIVGWFSSAKFAARRTPVPVSSSRSEQRPTSTLIHPWKDCRLKKENSFMFKHYLENKKYIEQYRNEHGCHIQQYHSAAQLGEMRRIAFQTTTGTHQPPTSAGAQQYGYTPSNTFTNPGLASHPPAGVFYSNRREQLGSLVTTNGVGNDHNTSPNCQCGTKASAIDTSSHKYKLSPGHLTRNATNMDFRTNVDSDNSSESGDIRMRTPSRRSSSASSTRHRQKPPTKISVPANTNARAYPIQALTIAWRLQRQQNGKVEGSSAPKPLDNLNCVAPEKQPLVKDRRNIEQLEMALKVHSLNDLLTCQEAQFRGHEAQLRGHALPRACPPQPHSNDKHLHSDPDLAGLTWAQKLEVLRAVSKKPEKSKVRTQKLKFIGDGNEQTFIWRNETDQLYEQRRIRHLLEQARVKGGNQYDWVQEAQVRARGIDWNTGKLKSGSPEKDSSDDIGDNNRKVDNGDTVFVSGAKPAGHDVVAKFSQYGIFSAQKASKEEILCCLGLSRSRTFMAP
ncbi:uncharacterized protein LOC127839052 isoform X2 [Dreissena polymorpha]|uniref:uncharacterized protein LOC127839052 isoform X2 n=1 Tax=Dreissena polymorpha TaxID=45954 RepID=UPI002263BA3D|nr:uncharacterized protein LOC127839052 isoform X2 [Dreissena polymorpha]